MMSLRRRLTLSLWICLLLIGGVGAGVAYIEALDSADEVLDYQLQQIAGFLSAQSQIGFPTAAEPSARNGDHDNEDDIAVSITVDDGHAISSSSPQWTGVRLPHVGFGTLSIHGADYRAYQQQSNGRNILVAQQIETRLEVARAAAFSAASPLVILMPILGIVVFVVTRWTLRPLYRLSQELAARSVLSTTPLRTDGIPGELRPLTDQMNTLLLRHAETIENEQRFIADAAHGLRTPLAALQLQADVLDGSNDVTERNERLGDLRNGITRTARLAEQLLALSRDGRNSISLHKSRIDDVLTSVIEQLRPIILQADIEVELMPRAKVDCVGDAHSLSVLFGNLIDNALRYSPPSGIVLIGSWLDGADVVVEIIDGGPGIPEADLARVFERFYRVADDTTEGNGLGLAVVRSIVRQLGGSVTLRNRSDTRGLIVEVRLPMSPEDGDNGG